MKYRNYHITASAYPCQGFFFAHDEYDGPTNTEDMMKNGRPQAKDIEDAAVLSALDGIATATTTRLAAAGWDTAATRWEMAATWDIASALGVDQKLALSKLRSMYRRKVLDCQCDCGCRGDWCRPENSPWGHFK